MMGGPYALLAVGVVVVGSLGYATIQHYRAEAAQVRADAAEVRAEELRQALTDSEAQSEALRVAAYALDLQLVERDRRARELDNAKRALKNELDRVKATLPKEDQSCLDRPLPAPILDRLRDGPDYRHEIREATSPGVPASTVPR